MPRAIALACIVDRLFTAIEFPRVQQAARGAGKFGLRGGQPEFKAESERIKKSAAREGPRGNHLLFGRDLFGRDVFRKIIVEAIRRAFAKMYVTTSANP